MQQAARRIPRHEIPCRREAPPVAESRCPYNDQLDQASWGRPTKMVLPGVSGDRMRRETLLARTFVEMADTLVADFDVVELLTRLADRCVDVLDVGAAGLMLAAPDGELRVMASSSEAMRLLELFELQAREGPCLDCYLTGEQVVNQDLAVVNGRWPRFASEALAAGFHSVHAADATSWQRHRRPQLVPRRAWRDATG